MASRTSDMPGSHEALQIIGGTSVEAPKISTIQNGESQDTYHWLH